MITTSPERHAFHATIAQLVLQFRTGQLRAQLADGLEAGAAPG
jgi:hypothetical protein